jgi:hypothetical protein
MARLRRHTIALIALAFLAATPLQPLDSQLVLERYELELSQLAAPKAMIFTYTVSQAGPTNIEQQHRVYRSGDKVRDETVSVDGQSLKGKLVRIINRADRYSVTRLAPRTTEYTMLFLRTKKNGKHFDYEYEATPIAAGASGFVVTRVVIDGMRDLPRTIVFHTSSLDAHGTGEIDYGPSSGHWVPFTVTIDAIVHGQRARERITWSDYQFPPSLPPSTFRRPKPLPGITSPPF